MYIQTYKHYECFNNKLLQMSAQAVHLHSYMLYNVYNYTYVHVDNEASITTAVWVVEGYVIFQ